MFRRHEGSRAACSWLSAAQPQTDTNPLPDSDLPMRDPRNHRPRKGRACAPDPPRGRGEGKGVRGPQARPWSAFCPLPASPAVCRLRRRWACKEMHRAVASSSGNPTDFRLRDCHSGSHQPQKLRTRCRAGHYSISEKDVSGVARIVGHADAGFSLRVYAKDARDEMAVVADVLQRAATARIGG
jgi:hypothetical protein